MNFVNVNYVSRSLLPTTQLLQCQVSTYNLRVLLTDQTWSPNSEKSLGSAFLIGSLMVPSLQVSGPHARKQGPSSLGSAA